MKKRITALLLAAIMITCLFPLSAQAASSLANFTKVNTYAQGQFTDVPSSAWYAENVRLAYELGLVNGKSATTFEPESNLTVAEAIKLAACLHSIYHTGAVTLQNGTPWYRTYADYALENGIIQSEYSNYSAPALRSDFASIFAKALPAEALTQINEIDDSAIPDVLSTYSYGASVYLLYRAGILTGSDAKGTFYPNSNIKRSEVATIVARMADVSYRKAFTLTPTSAPATNQALSATEISEKCSSAVFYIEIYNSAGEAFKSGSGFFIDSSGIAVTNYHVIKGASSAKITTTDGKHYDVAGVFDYSTGNDLALLKINGGPFPYLELGDSAAVKSGETVYTIGSPLGLQNSITSGIISNTARTFEGETVKYIQIDAAVSHGNSGGALINTSGKVIGVTTAGISGGQNINLAVPIHLTKELKRTASVTLKSILPKVAFYSAHNTIPDYGAFIGAPLYETESEPGYVGYFYRRVDIDANFDEAFYGYADLLEENGFELVVEFIDSNGYDTLVYENDKYTITFGPFDLDETFGMVVIIEW